MALTEGRHPGEFIVSLANGTRSREKVTILSGQVLYAGDILGKITVGLATAAAIAGNTGDGTMGAVVVSAGAKAGVYKLIIIEPGANAGKFEVEGPDGVIVGTGTVAAAFSKGGLAFTLADGATDFVAGDGFTITVAAGSGKCVGCDPDAANGSQIAAGFLYAAVDASAGDVTTGVAMVRSFEYNDREVSYLTMDAGEIVIAKAQLALLGIIPRAAI